MFWLGFMTGIWVGAFLMAIVIIALFAWTEKRACPPEPVELEGYDEP